MSKHCHIAGVEEALDTLTTPMEEMDFSQDINARCPSVKDNYREEPLGLSPEDTPVWSQAAEDPFLMLLQLVMVSSGSDLSEAKVEKVCYFFLFFYSYFLYLLFTQESPAFVCSGPRNTTLAFFSWDIRACQA